MTITVDMPRKMRRAALRSALTVKVQEESLVVIDELALEEAKTRHMANALNHLVGDASVLVLVNEKNENVERATRNMADTKLLRVNYLNIRDLLSYDKVVVPLAALDVIAEWLG